MDEESEICNRLLSPESSMESSMEEDFPQKAAFKRSYSECREDHESSSLAVKRPKIEMTASVASSSQGTVNVSSDMVPVANIPIFNQYKMNIGESSIFPHDNAVRSVEMDTNHFVQPPLHAFGSTQAAATRGLGLSSTEKSGNTPPFVIHRYREDAPLSQLFSAQSSEIFPAASNRILNPHEINSDESSLFHNYYDARSAFHAFGSTQASVPRGMELSSTEKNGNTPSVVIQRYREDEPNSQFLSVKSSENFPAASNQILNPHEINIGVPRLPSSYNTVGSVGMVVGPCKQMPLHLKTLRNTESLLPNRSENTSLLLMQSIGQDNILHVFPPESSARCATCENVICNRAGIICPTNFRHTYCLECTLKHILSHPYPSTCPSGENCVSANSVVPWSISRPLADFILKMHNMNVPLYRTYN